MTAAIKEHNRYRTTNAKQWSSRDALGFTLKLMNTCCRTYQHSGSEKCIIKFAQKEDCEADDIYIRQKPYLIIIAMLSRLFENHKTVFEPY
jgi:hypothetical protein